MKPVNTNNDFLNNKSTFVSVFSRLLTVILSLSTVQVLSVGIAQAATNDQSKPLGLPIKAQASISATVGRDENAYHARTVNNDISFSNKKHGLTATFGRKGMRLNTGDNQLLFEFNELKKGGNPVAVSTAQPKANVNRIEYQRGILTEWYVNGPLGLEQGFTIHQSPIKTPSKHSGDGLAFTLKVTGDLHPVIKSDNKDIVFTTSSGQTALQYRGLAAWDSNGKTLPSSWHVQDGKIALNVDDRNASYPITVDPFIEQAKLIASDGATGDHLGRAIAIAGDTVVVTAELDDPSRVGDGQGSAYVFEKPIGGWTGELVESAKLDTAGNTGLTEAAGFAKSIAISGDTVVVGAWQGSGFSNGQTISGQGNAYIFTKPAGGWFGLLNPSAKLTASDGGQGDLFGFSVDISGDAVVVGAYADDINTNLDQGSAYVFIKPAGGWSGTVNETAKLIASDGARNAWLGRSVAIDGNTVVVGAPHAQVGTSQVGFAYIFEKPAGGWNGSLFEAAQLRRDVNAETTTIYRSILFGRSVDISGDIIAVGTERNSSTVDNGRGYVFVKPSGGWSGILPQNATLIPVDGIGIEVSVSVSGDHVVLGRSATTVNGQISQGAAYVFEKPATGWSGIQTTANKLTASDGSASDAFGSSVAMDGKTIAIGSETDVVDAIASRGSAYVFATPDTTAPISSIFLSPEANTNGWHNASVHFTVTAEDETEGSGLAEIRCALNPTPNPTVFDDLPGVCAFSGSGGDVTSDGLHTLYAASRDNAGNKESPLLSRTTRIDTIKPTITAERSPLANGNGWNNSNITVNFQCNDNTNGSGMDTCSDIQTVSSEGANQSVSGTAKDLASNTETTTMGGINVDKTLPIISGSASPQANANGWNNTDVTVSYSCTDTGGSGVEACNPSQTLTNEGANQNVTGTVTDLAGNTASTVVNNISIDKTPPTITATKSPLPNNNGWNNTDVAVGFLCFDNTGGSGISVICGPNQILNSEGNNQSVTGSTTDLAGNSSSALISDIQIDKTPPVVSVIGVTNGATYNLGAVPTTSCETTDSLSGVATPAALTVTGGSPDETGTFIATCGNGFDNAGNLAQASVSYQVAQGSYVFSGFFQPVDNLPTFNQVKAGSGVAVKFSLGGDFGLNILASNFPASQGIACNASLPIDEIEQTVNVGGSSLTYNPTSGQYSYNWKTQKTWVGTCRQFILKLSDGSQQMAYFKFR